MSSHSATPRVQGRTIPAIGLYAIPVERLAKVRIRMAHRVLAIAGRPGRERALRRACCVLATIDETLEVPGRMGADEMYDAMIEYRTVAL